MPKIIENLRETILLRARDILINEGNDRLTMRYLSEKSDIAVGTLYNYFPTKRELTICLMEAYWDDFLLRVDEIDASGEVLIDKLRRIYKLLEYFIDTFMETWIKSNSSDIGSEALNRKNNYMEKLYKKLENILIKSDNIITRGRTDDVNAFILKPYEISKFLIQNFIMLAQMKQFDYENLEKIIIKILK